MKINKYIRVLVALGALVISAQYGGSNKSVDSTLPEVNVQARLIDANGTSYQLENVTIAGRCKQIPVFHKPLSPEGNPEYNMARIDLKDIESIVSHSKELFTFQKREYLEITITFKGSKHTVNNFIIPRNYMIRAQESLGTTQRNLEREFSFIALSSLTIDRVLSQEYRDISSENQSHQSALSCDQFVSMTDKLLKELENTSRQLPNQKNTLVNDIKNHLDYLINELKTTLNSWTKVSRLSMCS